jgi:hypothetical protein
VDCDERRYKDSRFHRSREEPTDLRLDYNLDDNEVVVNAGHVIHPHIKIDENVVDVIHEYVANVEYHSGSAFVGIGWTPETGSVAFASEGMDETVGTSEA